MLQLRLEEHKDKQINLVELVNHVTPLFAEDEHCRTVIEKALESYHVIGGVQEGIVLENRITAKRDYLNQSPCGMQELLCVLCATVGGISAQSAAIRTTMATTVLIDEPTTGLHPPVQRRLSDVLFAKRMRHCSVLVMTHAPQFVSNTSFDYLSHIVFVNGSKAQKVEIKDIKDKSIVIEKAKLMLFASHVLFVEGRDDEAVMCCFQKLVEEDAECNEIVKRWVGGDRDVAPKLSRWTVIPVGGKLVWHPSRFAKTLCVPYRVLLDNDALLSKREDGIPAAFHHTGLNDTKWHDLREDLRRDRSWLGKRLKSYFGIFTLTGDLEELFWKNSEKAVRCLWNELEDPHCNLGHFDNDFMNWAKGDCNGKCWGKKEGLACPYRLHEKWRYVSELGLRNAVKELIIAEPHDLKDFVKELINPKNLTFKLT